MILQAACIPSKGFFLLAGAAPGAFQTGLMDLDPFRSDPIQIHSVSQSSAPVAGGINFLWENLYPQHPPGPYPYYEDPRYFPAGTVRIRDLYNSCHAFYQSLKLNVSIGFSTFLFFPRGIPVAFWFGHAEKDRWKQLSQLSALGSVLFAVSNLSTVWHPLPCFQNRLLAGSCSH